MAFKGDGAAAGLSRTSDPPWTNSQRGVSIACWVKYDGSGITGQGTLCATNNKAGTVGGSFRLIKNGTSSGYGGGANSDNSAVANPSVNSTIKKGAWVFNCLRLFSTTLRVGSVSSANGGDIYGRTRITTSLTAHGDQTGVSVGYNNIVTPAEFLEPSFIVAHAMFWPYILSENEINALSNLGHPLDPRVCRRPSQYYPLLYDGYCAITGLKLSDVGTPVWVDDSPQLLSPNRVRLLHSLSYVASGSGSVVYTQLEHWPTRGLMRGLAR